mmetsp:Transcript_27297/g.73777  ORF Transcript_27297/g.73777 Transcript_27297/m.73777 type:complete len:244 (-) Transcript_27297:2155-2886(-)
MQARTHACAHTYHAQLEKGKEEQVRAMSVPSLQHLHMNSRPKNQPGAHEKLAAVSQSFWYTIWGTRKETLLAKRHRALSSLRSVNSFSRDAPAFCAAIVSAAMASTSCSRSWTAGCKEAWVARMQCSTRAFSRGTKPISCSFCSARSWRPLRDASISSQMAPSWSKASTSRCDPVSALGPMRARASWPRMVKRFSATAAPVASSPVATSSAAWGSTADSCWLRMARAWRGRSAARYSSTASSG